MCLRRTCLNCANCLRGPEKAATRQKLSGDEVVMLAGQLKTGATVSFTVTVNEPLEEFEAASLTVQLTVSSVDIVSRQCPKIMKWNL